MAMEDSLPAILTAVDADVEPGDRFVRRLNISFCYSEQGIYRVDLRLI